MVSISPTISLERAVAIFRIHITRGSSLTVSHEATGADELAFQLTSRRWLLGDLIAECEQPIDPPVRVLIPAQQIQMIVET